ncbi:MAG: ATP-binding protein [Candidatus Xenobiia bacterium LiM19]
MLELLIDDFQERKIPELMRRTRRLKQVPGRASVIVGMRRVGKTYFCFQTIKELLDSGIERERILYLNFEDERLLPFSHTNFQDILDMYYRRFPSLKEKHCHLFLDEVQRIEGWDMFVRRILDSEDISIYVTGSSSKLLSSEIATSLRGRALSTEIFPFSFREFLNFRAVRFGSSGHFSSRIRAQIQHFTDHYLIIGGFPEVQTVDEDLRRQFLRDYLDVVILRDVIERYGVTNTSVIRALIRHMINAPASRFSVNKFYNSLKSQGIVCTKNNLYDYVEYLCDVFLAYQVHIHARSERIRAINPRKIYVIDPGLIAALSHNEVRDRGAMLENIVYMHLRMQGILPEYYLTKSGKEVDFYIPLEYNAECHLIQVCWKMDDEKTKARELKALDEAMKELKLTHGTVITWMDEDLSDDRIKIVPGWKWLLTDER